MPLNSEIHRRRRDDLGISTAALGEISGIHRNRLGSYHRNENAMSTQATINGIEPFIASDPIALCEQSPMRSAGTIPFGSTAVESRRCSPACWCWKLPDVNFSEQMAKHEQQPAQGRAMCFCFKSLIPDEQYKRDGYVAPRDEPFDLKKSSLPFKEILLVASQLGVEVSAIKETHRFLGREDEQIRSKPSRPWTPARASRTIQRLLKVACALELWNEKSSVSENELIVDGVCDEEGRELEYNDSLEYSESSDDNEFSGAEQPAFIEGTNSIDFRGSRKPDTKETRAVRDEEAARLEAIVQSGQCWSILDPPEKTIIMPNGEKLNTENVKFRQAVFDYNVLFGNHDGQRKLAEELGIKFETARKQELEMVNKDKTFPATLLPVDDRLAVWMGHDLGGNVYVHVTLDRGRWYRLNMDKHESYAEAIEEVRWKAQDEAFDKAGVPKRRTDTRTFGDNPELAEAFEKVVARFSEAFNPSNLFILDLRTPTVRAFAEIEAEKWGTKYQFGAISGGTKNGVLKYSARQRRHREDQCRHREHQRYQRSQRTDPRERRSHADAP